MRNVRIGRAELLKIVRENKDKHVAAYIESVSDYTTAALNLAKRNLKLAQSGELDKIAQIKGMPQKPVSYEKEYDRAIRMLELSVDEVVDLQQDVFNQLVLDEWSWKNTFVSTTAMYKTL